MSTQSTDSLPPQSRLSDAKTAEQEYSNLVTNDPQAQRRQHILRAYYRFPYAMSKEESSSCLLKESARANHGGLADKVDQAKIVYLDQIYERPRSVRFDYTGPIPENMSRKMVGVVMAEAFETHVVHGWEKYYADKELEVQDMLLYGKAVAMRGSGKVWPEYVPVECVHPNLGASFFPSEWEYCFVDEEWTASKLWQAAEDDEAWDRKAIMDLLRTNPSLRRKMMNGSWEQLAMDGSFCSSLETVQLWLVALYVKEWDGSVTKSYFTTEGGIRTRSKRDWLWRKENAEECMDDVFVVFTDNLGHGKWYYAPSLAEKLFLVEKERDLTLNRAKNSAWINSMLMMEGTGDQSRRVRVFRDNMMFEPGTKPVQTSFNLPMREILELSEYFDAQGRKKVGFYNTTETRETAEQVKADLMQQSRVSGVALKRFNLHLGRELELVFDALVEHANPEGDEWYDEAFSAYIKACKDGGVPKNIATDEDNIQIKSLLLAGAGDPAIRFQQASMLMQLLNVSPMSEEQAKARNDAIAAITGVGNMSDYTPPIAPEPTDEGRIIGMENEALNDPNATVANIQLLPTDNDVLHLFGDRQRGGSVVGHLEMGGQTLKEGLQMLEAQPLKGDESLLADKIANRLNSGNNYIEHASLHLAKLARDARKKRFYDEARAFHAEIIRMRDELANNFAAMQEARARNQQQDEQGKSKAQQAQELHDVKLAAEIKKGEAAVDKIRRTTDATVEAETQKAAAKLATQTLAGVAPKPQGA